MHIKFAQYPLSVYYPATWAEQAMGAIRKAPAFVVFHCSTFGQTEAGYHSSVSAVAVDSWDAVLKEAPYFRWRDKLQDVRFYHEAWVVTEGDLRETSLSEEGRARFTGTVVPLIEVCAGGELLAVPHPGFTDGEKAARAFARRYAAAQSKVSLDGANLAYQRHLLGAD